MPGPGGGAHGGGGRRGGGGFGGSHGGGGFGGPRGGFGGPRGGFGGPRGGFGGPHMGGFGGPHMGGFGWHHRPHHHGGGCLSGVLGMFLFPVVIVIFVLIILFSSCSVNYTTVGDSGMAYDEEMLQDFADKQYAAEFGASTAYEDNLLIVVLTDENNYDYCYIAWVGDDIATDISHLFGAEETEFGQAMSDGINMVSYKYSLDSNLARVMEKMTQEISALGLTSSYKCEENHIQVESHLKNMTELEMTEETVNTALKEFTETTGIPTVIVVEDAEDVFNASKTIEPKTVNIWTALAIIVVVGFVVFLIVRAILNRKGNSQ